MATRARVHYAWVVLAVVAVTMVAATGLRQSFGVFIKPMEAEFGWDRTSLSLAAALSLLLLGAMAPLAGRMADLWGARAVLGVSMAVLGAGTLASSFVTELWHVYMASGVLMALGAGGANMSTASSLAARWFEKRRGLAIGIAGAGLSAGQPVVVPLAMWLTLRLGWRGSYFWLGVGFLALIIPLAMLFIRDDPKHKGLEPYGASARSAETAGSRPSEPRVSLLEAAQVPAFWLLAASFFICGYTSGGLVLTHLIPHTVEHGFREMTSAQAVGAMGAMTIFGTIASGWTCDHFGRKGPLAFFYFFRGLSLLFLLVVWNVPSLYLFAAIFGLNYFSTLPPTTALTANIFGRYSVGELSGWIYFSHQVGSALGAAMGGWVFDWTGSYFWAFLSAGILALVGAALPLAIREEPLIKRPPATVPVPPYR